MRLNFPAAAINIFDMQDMQFILQSLKKCDC